MKEKITKLIVMVVFLLTSGCTSYFNYDAEYEYPIQADSINFKLSKEENTEDYVIRAFYKNAAYIHIYGRKKDSIKVFASLLYYNRDKELLYIPFPGGGSHKYYVLGKGKIVNSEFKPLFLEGTRFAYHPSQHKQLDVSVIIIYMPKIGYELLVNNENEPGTLTEGAP